MGQLVNTMDLFISKVALAAGKDLPIHISQVSLADCYQEELRCSKNRAHPSIYFVMGNDHDFST